MSEFPRKRHGKDETVEARLAELNERIAGMFEDGDAAVERPVVLVVGHQRCGATLVGQYLVSRLRVGYPSNVIARFWRAPVVGIEIQRALFGEPGGHRSSFSSELGATRGPLEPHEFSYFWDYWFPRERSCRDDRGLVRAIANMERAFAAPLVFKNVFNALRMDALAKLLPTAVFVRVRRDLLDVACSTLDCRRLRFGDDRAWFGVRPEACAELSDASPCEQIAHQIYFTEKAMTDAITALGDDRVIELDYAAFCDTPDAIVEPLRARGVEPRDGVELPASFERVDRAARHPDAGDLAAALAAAGARGYHSS